MCFSVYVYMCMYVFMCKDSHMNSTDKLAKKKKRALLIINLFALEFCYIKGQIPANEIKCLMLLK